MSKECTLTNDKLIEKCNQWVKRLADTGGSAWTLKVPVDFDNDPDMLFCELGKRLKETEEKLEEKTRQKIALQQEVDRLTDELEKAGIKKPAIVLDYSRKA